MGSRDSKNINHACVFFEYCVGAVLFAVILRLGTALFHINKGDFTCYSTTLQHYNKPLTLSLSLSLSLSLLPSFPPSLSPFCLVRRYEWVDVGMIDYDSATKLYKVKRVHVPNHVLKRNKEREEEEEEEEEAEKGKGEGKEEGVEERGGEEGGKGSSGSSSQSESEEGEEVGGAKVEVGGASPASDGEQKAERSKETAAAQKAGKRKVRKCLNNIYPQHCVGRHAL